MGDIVVFLDPRIPILCTIMALTASAWSAEPFPSAAQQAVSIGGKLPGSHETSGIAWHTGLQKFFLVSDAGTVTSMTATGTKLIHWPVDGDLEAVTIARPQSSLIYLGIEDPDSIYEFNILTGLVTRIFDLTPWMKGPDNSGLEALTFVPDPANPEGGLFYAGLQEDARIFVFRLPILSSATSTAVTWVRTIQPINGVANISDLTCVTSQNAIYAIYDKDDILRAMETDGTLIGEWALPGQDQEGVAIKGSELYITEDYGGDGGDVLRYAPFAAIPQPDLNADGKVNLTDLAILAAAWASESQITAADISGDGLVDTMDLVILADFWLGGTY
ncbi:MAG: SdiA-regulated domain-containing protein [Sedimentisphaerales bacterium]|nr:SdiA-regulated domain-containing protein [Sedimentisphaerales bacterium]